MPNGIHNIRTEDDLSGTEFRDVVHQGAGADTVNRYLDTTSTLPSGSGSAATLGGSRR